MDFFDWFNLFLFILGTILILLSRIDNFLSAIILWFTAIVILQYTKETYHLKNIERKQLDFNRTKYKSEAAPFLVPIYPRDDYKICSPWLDYRIPIENKNSCFVFNIEIQVKDNKGNIIEILQDRDCMGRNDRMEISFKYRDHIQKILPPMMSIKYKSFDGKRSFITEAEFIESGFGDNDTRGTQIVFNSYKEINSKIHTNKRENKNN